MNKQYNFVSKKMDLVEYIYYLQYQMEIDNITVETADATCNGIVFEYVNGKFVSVEPINMKVERFDNILHL